MPSDWKGDSRIKPRRRQYLQPRETTSIGVVLAEQSLIAITQKGVPMIYQCPNCLSERTEARHLARRTGGLIGTIGGSVGGAMSCMSGSRIGMTVGVVAGPPGMIVGGLLGALIGSLVGGTAGGLAGAQLGEVIDDRVLDNYRCLACGHCFSNARPEPIRY